MNPYKSVTSYVHLLNVLFNILIETEGLLEIDVGKGEMNVEARSILSLSWIFRYVVLEPASSATAY